jgi:hypothetical protein
VLNDRNLARGLFIMAISLAFGLTALRYPIGDLARAGAGLFPLLVSSLLFLVGVATVVRSRFTEGAPLEFNVKNIGVILGSLGGFALFTLWLNMVFGIVFLVFCSTLAGKKYSWVRNVKVSVGLIAVAYAFQKGLGLNLPLF